MKKIIPFVAAFVALAVVLGLCYFQFWQNRGLPKLYFAGDISNMESKSDIRSIEVRYKDGLRSFHGFAQLKIQGTSSLEYDKKNYTIGLFKDAEHTRDLNVNVGWGRQNEYCLKANWIDKTHARNIITANLATQVQRKYDLLSDAPEHGAIDGFPIEIYINDEFLGIYTFNIPKAEWMFGMDGENPNHIVFCGEGWDPANLFADAPTFETWAIEVGEENEETLAKLDELFSFVINSTDEEFKENFEQHISLDAALNYYILSDFAYLADNYGKNMLLATYDGVKWYPSLYDLDASWGAHWSGTYTYDYDTYLVELNDNQLFARLEQNFGKELAARYTELREQILTKEHIMSLFRDFEASIPQQTWSSETEKWGDEIPGFGISQIEEYLNTVIPILDEKYAQFGK